MRTPDRPVLANSLNERCQPLGPDAAAGNRTGLEGGRVLLLAPSGIVRDGLAALLERGGLSVVAPAREVATFSGPAAVALIHEGYPGAPSAIEALGSRNPPIRSVLLFERWDEDGLKRLVASCAAGAITRSQPTADLLRGLTVVAAGGAVLPPNPYAPPGPPAPSAAKLTTREAQVLALMIEHSTGQIAQRLGISVNTVRTHVAAVMAKLEVHSRLCAVVTAFEQGLIDRPHRQPRSNVKVAG